MEKTSLYLPAGLQRALRDAARREGRAQADIVRDALTAYLAGNPRPRPSIIGIAKGTRDDGVSSANIKAWVRREWAKDLERKAGAKRRARADD